MAVNHRVGGSSPSWGVSINAGGLETQGSSAFFITMKVMIPPIKCQGIKSKLVPFIKQVVDWSFEGRWIEPFMGSGVVGFNIMPHDAVFADSNPHLINFYNAIAQGKIDGLKVRQFLEEQGEKLSRLGQNYYYEVRERFNKTHEPLDFLFLNRCCFN